MADELVDVQVPAEFVKLCRSGWSGALDSMTYAIASTGNLSLGSVRPRHFDTRQEWHAGLFSNLEFELADVLAWYEAHDPQESELPTLRRFAAWARQTAAALHKAYGMEDADGRP